jgi:hypothetical protein
MQFLLYRRVLCQRDRSADVNIVVQLGKEMSDFIGVFKLPDVAAIQRFIVHTHVVKHHRLFSATLWDGQ